MAQSAIRLDAVTKNFDDQFSGRTYQVIRGIDLEIPKGAFVSIIGPSGVGKSTLINLIGGMLQPTTGGVYVFDKAVHLMDDQSLNEFHRNYVGFLWQSPRDNLFPEMSAIDNVAFPLQANNLAVSSQTNRINDLFEQVRMSHRKSHSLRQLSGGEAQKVGLISALANEPDLLLADEPTGELDVKTKFEVLEYLREINQEFGTTILLVTHDLEIAAHTDLTYKIEDGTIAGLTGRPPSNEKGSKIQKQKNRSVQLIDQFGRVKIPNEILKGVLTSRFVRFNLEDGVVRLEKVEDDEF